MSLPNLRALVLWSVLAVTLPGCAGLSFQVADVAFSEPFFESDFSFPPPDANEASGVRLRELPPEDGSLTYHGRSLIYARTKEGRGLRFEFEMDRADTYANTDRDDIFHKTSETVISEKGGEIYEETYVTARGEITQFIEGRHESKAGKFEVLHSTRSPLYPADPVGVGDTWTHTEEIELKLHSFFIKQKAPSRRRVEAKNTLRGFTTFAGRRVAVILTEATEKSRETLSVLFKSIEMNISTQIQQITYFDYERNRVMRQVVSTLSRTDVVGTALKDTGKSQTIVELAE